MQLGFLVKIGASFLSEAKTRRKRGSGLFYFSPGVFLVLSNFCLTFLGLQLTHEYVPKSRPGKLSGLIQSLYLLPEIEMVIMERSKAPELAASTSVQEQNTTDEEKSAATGLESVQWSR